MGQKTDFPNYDLNNVVSEQDVTLYWPGYTLLKATFSPNNSGIALESTKWLQATDEPAGLSNDIFEHGTNKTPTVLEAGFTYHFELSFKQGTEMDVLVTTDCPDEQYVTHSLSSLGKQFFI